MKNLAIVPARAGSKRLPGKNIRQLAGKPLIHYTLEAASLSGCFDKILFSSDSEEYLEVASRVSGVVPDERPQTLAGDTVKVIDAVQEIAARDDVRNTFDTITLLLPTCPFRRASDIRRGFEMLDDSTDAVVSMTEFEFPITMSAQLASEQGHIDFVFNPSPLVTGNTRSQDHKSSYRPNGGFYIAWAKSLRAQSNFFSGRVKACLMPREYSADVDTHLDFAYAEFLMKNNFVDLNK